MRFKLLIFILAAAFTASAATITLPDQAWMTGTFVLNGTGTLNHDKDVFYWGPGSDTDANNLSVGGNSVNDRSGVYEMPTLWFHNGTNPSVENMSVLLNLTLHLNYSHNLDDPSPEQVLLNYQLAIDNTPDGRRDSNPDTVQLPPVSAFDSPQYFTHEGVGYMVTVLGWSLESDDHASLSAGNLFGVDENHTGQVNLKVNIAPGDPTSTPEPGTISMALLGLGVLVAARKFRRAH